MQKKKNEWQLALLASFAVVALIFLFSFFFFAAGFKPTYIVEDPLSKNSQFSLLPGDVLVYNYTSGNESLILTFMFTRRPLPSSTLSHIVYENCTLVILLGENLSTCIYPDGRDGEGNQSLAPGFFFFAPWMLALSPDFEWKTSMHNSITGQLMQTLHIRVNSTQIMMGREAYVVDAEESGIFGNFTRKIWVDKKNRIVLKEEARDYSLSLIQARFPLQH